MARNKARLELSREQEAQIVAWYRENEILYNTAADGFYDPSEKERLWLEKAAQLGITSDQLQVFIRDLRTQFVKMVKMDPEERSSLTERKKWLLQTFEFLRAHVSHRLHAKKTKKGSKTARQGAGKAGSQSSRGTKGNETASQEARRAGSQASRGTKASRKGDQEEPDSEDMDISEEEEEELGWVKKDKKSVSLSPQGKACAESSPESGLPGQQSLDEGHVSQRSVLDTGQDIPTGSKRRKLQPAYCAPPSAEGRLTGADASDREASTMSPSDCSSSEGQGWLGCCLTCQNPLLPSDSGKMSLLAAVDGETKLLYILRQMGWPGLYSQDSGSGTCCGSCAQLIWEYNNMLTSMLALKARWMRCTGHNSAPHLNQFHQEAFMTRDSCIESSRSNGFRTERRNQRVQADFIPHPCKEKLPNQFTEVDMVNNRHPAGDDGLSQQDIRGVRHDVNSVPVSHVGVLRVKEEPHEDGEPHQVSVGQLRRPDRMTEPSPNPHQTLLERPKKASHSYHQLQPGIADDDPSVKTPGQGRLYRRTVNLLTAGSGPASEGESFVRACDGLPPGAATSSDEHLRVQGQKCVYDNSDIGPKADQNFDPRQGTFTWPVVIEQGQDFYGDETFIKGIPRAGVWWGVTPPHLKVTSQEVHASDAAVLKMKGREEEKGKKRERNEGKKAGRKSRKRRRKEKKKERTKKKGMKKKTVK